MSVLALICPDPDTLDNIPVIIGTNTNLFKCLAALGQEDTGNETPHALRIHTLLKTDAMLGAECQTYSPDDMVGPLTWVGPGPLTLALKKECLVGCKVQSMQSKSNGVLLVEASEMVAPSSL